MEERTVAGHKGLTPPFVGAVGPHSDSRISRLIARCPGGEIGLRRFDGGRRRGSLRQQFDLVLGYRYDPRDERDELADRCCLFFLDESFNF